MSTPIVDRSPKFQGPAPREAADTGEATAAALGGDAADTGLEFDPGRDYVDEPGDTGVEQLRRAIDPDHAPRGAKSYVIFYVAGEGFHEGRDSAMFEQAARTRARDLQASPDFDPSRDRVLLRPIQELGEIGPAMRAIKADNDRVAMDTAEVDIYSHAGIDGPIGGERTSVDELYQNQMSLSGWSKIDYDWAADDARMIMHGCNTGVAFGPKISAAENMKGVEVWGQSSSSFPSQYTDHRSLWQVPTSTSAITDEEAWAPTGDQLYMVSDEGRRGPASLWWSFESKPMIVSEGGAEVRTEFPPGEQEPSWRGWLRSWIE